MLDRTRVIRLSAVVASVALVGLGLAACSSSGGGSGGKVSISYLAGGNDPATLASAKALKSAFEKANPTITMKIETRPGGTDGDNLIKTRLSTGDMQDVFNYNSGSLFQALAPKTTLAPLTDEPWVSKLTKEFKVTTTTDGQTYGAPFGTSFAGGIMYNKKVSANLGLSVPTTWNEFLDNSKKIKAAGITPILQTYGDTWTSQLFVLGSFANITAKNSKWPTQYTANDASAKYAKQPGLAGFQHTEEVFKEDLVNKDFASLTNVNGLKALAEGTAAQYPMITNTISNVVQSNPDKVNDIGYFPLPADSAAETRMTIWEPNALYIPKSTSGDKLAAAKKLVAFANSSAGCEVQNKTGIAAGPYAISSCTVPKNAPALVADEQKYIDDNKVGVALEFLSPIKGPNLEKILIQVGSGISTASQGAALYDGDVKKQAQQLGIKGWN